MESPALIVMLALAQYMYFTGRTGLARGKDKVEAPACSGNEHFERVFRVQQNTMEQLVIFIPGMFVFAHVASPVWALSPGVVFLVGRAWYAYAYVNDPPKRAPGMVLTFLSNLVLVLGSIIGLAVQAGGA